MKPDHPVPLKMGAGMIRFAIFWALLFWPATSLAQTIQAPGQPATAPYTDAASGFTFPVAVGDFKRFRLGRGGPPESISAGYAYLTSQARMAASIFVDHPRPDENACQKMAEADREITRQTHPQARFAELVSPAVAGYTATAFSSRYDAPFGANERYYYCRNGWVVQFNFQHPPGLDAGALEVAFLRDIQPSMAEKH
jgi:hypothetical protein